MNKMISKLKTKAQAATIAVQTTLASRRGEGYIDTGVKILIAVVLGALLLAGLYALFNTNIMPSITTAINKIFGYGGAVDGLT